MATTVTKENVKQNGIDICAKTKEMMSSLEIIKGYVNGTKDCFDSEAGDAIRSKFNKSAEKFEEFRSFLNSYGEFLQNYASNVTSFEEAMRSAADEIAEM